MLKSGEANESPHVVSLSSAQGGNLTPSVVRIDARGNALVGQRARRFLESDPSLGPLFLGFQSRRVAQKIFEFVAHAS